MDRRLFIRSLLGVAGSAVAVSAFSSKAQALPLLDELQAMDAAGSNPLQAAAASDADLPAEGAEEAQYYYRRRYAPRRRYYYAPRRYYRRPRCAWVRNRWGRLVRRCW